MPIEHPKPIKLSTKVDGRKVLFQVNLRRYGSRTWREMETKPRLYVSVPDETILDNLIDRTSRPHTVWGRILREAIVELGPIWGSTTIRWSQKAGCSCPCSPGFIVTNAPMLTFKQGDWPSNRYDIWATIEGVPTVVEDDPIRQERAMAIAADPTL